MPNTKRETQRVRNIIFAITQSTLKWFYITTMYTRYNEQSRKPKKPQKSGQLLLLLLRLLIFLSDLQSKDQDATSANS